MTAGVFEDRARVPAPGLAGPVWFLLAALGATAVFWEGFLSLGTAWALPEYSHGPLIPLVSLWLYLREMRSVPPSALPVTDRRPGLLVTLFSLLVGLFGHVVQIPDLVTYGFILWVAGLILTCYGWRRGVIFWPSVLHLVYMLPLPNAVYWPLSIKLQFISSEIGVMLIRAFGVPVLLEGNVIDLGIYKLQVAEACSGLRYLFPILSFSYITALIYRGPLWHRIVLLLAAAPITVLMNSFRIGVIGILVDSYGIEHAEGFLHAFEGWIIFMACVAILLLMAMALQRLTRNPKPLSEALDLDVTGLHLQLARVRAVAPSSALAAGALAAAGLGLAMHLVPARNAVEVARSPLVTFPREIGPWQGTTVQLDAGVERVLQADDYLSATFFTPGFTPGFAPGTADAADAVAGGPVDLFIAFYKKQAGGAAIHSPAVCLPAGGWEVSAWAQEERVLAGGRTVPVNRAVIQKGLSRQLVFYWFEQRGRQTTSDYAAKLLTVWDSAVTGRSDGALVRVITPIAAGEAVETAAARLDGFLEAMLPVLPAHVPGAGGS